MLLGVDVKAKIVRVSRRAFSATTVAESCDVAVLRAPSAATLKAPTCLSRRG